MSALDEARSRLLALHERVAETGPAWLAPLRRSGAETFAAEGLPHTKLEEWRYTNLAGLAKLRFDLPEPDRTAVSRTDLETLASPVFACSLHVFVDGFYAPELSALGAHVENLASLGEAPAELGALIDGKQHPLAALNTALLGDGALLRIPHGARIEEPIHVVFAATGAVRSPRLLVIAEAGSRVQVIQDCVSLPGDAGFSNAVTEICVGENARVDLVTVQRESDTAFHVSNTAVRVDRDGRFESHVLTLGGQLVRNDLSLTLAGEGSDATLNGLFLGAGERLIDNHSLVDHAQPHGTSRQLYKGILGGGSRGVFRGRVVVRPDAQHTNAGQSNPNLLLSDSAEIDTKPQLEIHADDVKCSHGSSIGQLDEEALFYLRSRAIDTAEARDLLSRGFAHEVLGALPVEALRQGLENALEQTLATTTGRSIS